MRFRLRICLERELPPDWELRLFDDGVRLFHERYGYVRPKMFLIHTVAYGFDGQLDREDPFVGDPAEALLAGEQRWSIEEAPV